MGKRRVFVGREAELAQFIEVLEDEQGQAVIVVGDRGRGKTWLLDRMAEQAEMNLNYDCLALRYTVTPTDPVSTIMSEIMDDAADAIWSLRGRCTELVGKNRRKIAALFGAAGLIPVVGSKVKAVVELAASLTEREKAGNVREQFVEVLVHLSQSLPNNARVLVIIDPEKYVQERSDYAWGLVLDRLPSKIVFLFAQRPNDELLKGEGLKGLTNVVRIPEGELKPFDENAVDQLVQQSLPAPKEKYLFELRTRLRTSDQEPYTIGGATELVARTGIRFEEWATYLTLDEVAKLQWRAISAKGDDAIRLFQAYAILEVSVPQSVVQAVSSIEDSVLKDLESDIYVRGLLQDEGKGRRIYHAILVDYILNQMSESQIQDYHIRAAGVYQERLRPGPKVDTLSATRLPRHALAGKGPGEFIRVLVDHCFSLLLDVGLHDEAVSMAQQALKFARAGSREEGMLYGHIGCAYKNQGDLSGAEAMLQKALEVLSMQSDLGDRACAHKSLGDVYVIKGDLQRAEEMFSKAVKGYKKEDRPNGVADTYRALGFLYHKQGRIDSAERVFREALEIDLETRNMRGLADSFRFLGYARQAKDDFQQAEELLLKALELDEEMGILDNVAADCTDLAAVYGKQGQLDKALDLLQRARGIYERLQNRRGLAGVHASLGLVHVYRREFAEAKRLLNIALEAFRESGDLEGISQTYLNLGFSCMHSGEFSRAEEMLMKALRKFEDLHNLEGQANVYRNLATICSLADEQFEQAITYAEKARGLYRNMGLENAADKVQEMIWTLKERRKSAK